MVKQEKVSVMLTSCLILATASISFAAPRGMGRLSSLDRRFVTMAAQGGVAEVASGNLAARRAHDPLVKQIGQTLVDDHSKANRELMEIGTSERFAVPAHTDARHRALMARLQRLSGTAFDRAFIAAQLQDHVMAIQLFQREEQNGSNPRLRAFAAKYLPPIQGHTQMIRQAAGDLHTNSIHGRMRM